ncbi:hypothetical protein J3B02_000976 [Coemansia erecta]|nr:hypothetical protein J3B02_000976 [Coemansia erecta]
MTSLSCFQTLPQHIIRTIVRYYLIMQNSGLCDKACDKTYNKASEFSLLHTSHQWRYVFAQESLAHLCIYLSDKPDTTKTFYKWPSIIGPPCFDTEHLVNTLFIGYIGWRPLKTPMSAESLCNLVFGSRQYDHVQTVRVFLDLDGSFDTEGTVQTLGDLFAQLKHIAPNCRKLDIQSIDSEETNFGYSPCKLVAAMLAGLSDKISCISTSQSSSSLDVFVPASFSHFTHLTRLKFSCNGVIEWFSTVVQKNSRTLTRLTASNLNRICVRAMIFDSEETPVVYPQMERLKLRFNSEYLEYNQEQFCHFPNIKRLILLSYYPVCSSVFVNSSSTLEYLQITVLPRIVQFAQNYPVFGSKQLSNLKHASISFEGRLEDDQQMYRVRETELLFVKKLLMIPKVLSRFDMPTTGESPMSSCLVDHQLLVQIQVLNFSHLRFEFSGLVSLLKQAPLLRVLDLTIRDTRPMIDGVSDQDIVGYIGKQDYPLSKYLCRLSISSDTIVNCFENYVLTIALLAVGCPRLTVVDLMNLNIVLVAKGLLEIARSGEFSVVCLNQLFRITFGMIF